MIPVTPATPAAATGATGIEAPLPAGACDCHVHVVGDAARYPMVADRHYTPGPASAGDLRAHLARLGLERAVIVQPSVYGTDNRCLLDALAALGGRGRGVAVVDADAAPHALQEELQALHRAGVRGLRINLESSGQGGDAQALLASLQAWADRIRGLPWHLQLYAGLDTLAAAAPGLARLGVPVVFDHFAMAPAATPADSPALRAVLAAVRSGVAYVKLSAAYRIGGDPAGVERLARAFHAANPQRVLWASDWPHTDREPGKDRLQVSAYRDVPAERLAREIRAWAPDAAALQAMLVDNPARLYGF